MQPDNLNVFDFDGTIIKVNSFREISKQFAIRLLQSFQVIPLLTLMSWLILRRLNIISHLKFKEKVVNIFESALSEDAKKQLCQDVFDKNVNEIVLKRISDLNNCLISTAAPFAYISRISMGREIPIIAALQPDACFPDRSNFAAGKVANIRAYFKGQRIRIQNVFSDSEDDQPLIDLSVNAFVCKGNRLVKIK